MKLSGDTYADNILAQQRALERRVAALERQLAGGAAAYDMGLGTEGATGATPDGMLPNAAAIPRLWVVAQNSGAVYEIECEDQVGPGQLVKLRPRYVGQVRGG